MFNFLYLKCQGQESGKNLVQFIDVEKATTRNLK